MKRKNPITFRPNEKALSYMKSLNLLDGRDGKKKDDLQPGYLSRFINECIILSVEQDLHGKVGMVPLSQLNKAYLEMLLRRKARECEQGGREFAEVQRRYRESFGEVYIDKELEVER